MVFLASLLVCADESRPIQIFGYFQNSFQHWTAQAHQDEQNSFSVQQLNAFFQKGLGENWTALVNFEFVNNFSSRRQWGSATLEEAWARYRHSEKFNAKFGMQIPIFNNLNEVKNRTPVIPYVIRPVIYEASFGEFIPLDNFVPASAFMQFYGFLSKDAVKFDYAAYIGNSPNVSMLSDVGPERPSGLDTTITLLYGGRVGIRYRDLKLGVSATIDKDNQFFNQAAEFGLTREELREATKTRLGSDLSFTFDRLSFEGEIVIVDLGRNLDFINLDLNFFYLTLGYQLQDNLQLYISYWENDNRFEVSVPNLEQFDDQDIMMPNLGFAYDLNERIRIKGHYAYIDIVSELALSPVAPVDKLKSRFSVYAAAMSIFF